MIPFLLFIIPNEGFNSGFSTIKDTNHSFNCSNSCGSKVLWLSLIPC